MIEIESLDWKKGGGLIPAIVQHAHTGAVLMLGYVSRESLRATLDSGEVWFHSRSRGALWKKGETSGNVLKLVDLHADCDCDALLLRAEPAGPTCHLGTRSCFGAIDLASGFFAELDALVAARAHARPAGSYTTQLFDAGVRRIAQKVGEEGVETALAAVAQDETALLDEAADLIFHLTVLLRARGLGLADVSARLAQRHAHAER